MVAKFRIFVVVYCVVYITNAQYRYAVPDTSFWSFRNTQRPSRAPKWGFMNARTQPVLLNMDYVNKRPRHGVSGMGFMDAQDISTLRDISRLSARVHSTGPNIRDQTRVQVPAHDIVTTNRNVRTRAPEVNTRVEGQQPGPLGTDTMGKHGTPNILNLNTRHTISAPAIDNVNNQGHPHAPIYDNGHSRVSGVNVVNTNGHPPVPSIDARTINDQPNVQGYTTRNHSHQPHSPGTTRMSSHIHRNNQYGHRLHPGINTRNQIPPLLHPMARELRLPNYCRIDSVMSSVRCVIPSGVTLDYDTLKQWTMTTGMDHAVNIECLPGGIISLPWPMKARHIISLTVHDCVMTNFFKTMGTSVAIPDKMRSLVLMSSIIRFNIEDVFELLKRFSGTGLPKDSECGQQTLKKYIFRDIKFDIIKQPTSNSQYSRMGQYVNSFVRMAQLHTCNYRYLSYIDESGTQDTSIYQFKMLTSNSLFPSLTTYRASRVGLRNIPKELANYPRHFPCLSTLDLSSNSISYVNLTFDGRNECRLLRPTYINLRHNNIQMIPGHLIEFLMDNRVIIDIRNNPVNCAFMGDLSSYIIDMQANYPKFRNVLDNMPCTLPTALQQGGPRRGGITMGVFPPGGPPLGGGFPIPGPPVW